MSSLLILVEKKKCFLQADFFFNKGLGGEFQVIATPTGSPSFLGFDVKSIEKSFQDAVDSIVFAKNSELSEFLNRL